jgi:hypothetical protein
MGKARIRGKIPMGEAAVYQVGGKMYIYSKNSGIIMTSAPPKRKKPLKRRVPPAKTLPPAPLPQNSAGFGKCWIGGDLYRVVDDMVIPKAALDSMKQKRGR